MSIKLEVGKRYVLRNGEVVGPLSDYGSGDFRFTARNNSGQRLSWRIDGSERLDGRESCEDIVSEYIEPQPEPLRWQENCKPDKPGIWLRMDEKSITAYVVGDLQGDDAFDWETATRCYLGPIPEILPPKKKVVQRLWLEPTDVPAITGCRTFIERWFVDGASDTQINDWIRTDRTREVEQ